MYKALKFKISYFHNKILELYSIYHRDHGIHIEAANMQYQGIACTRISDTGLTLLEGQKLEYFK
jgi:hypothetical protein